jgi:hypothetical protein
MSVAGHLGRHLLGVAAVGFGVIAWRWHDFNEWHQLRSLWGAPAGPAWVYGAAVTEIIGGLAIQARRTAGVGAALLGIVYLIFAVRWIPRIVAGPQVYDGWGNLFEQLALVAGALIVYGSAAEALARPSKLAKIGYYLFGICVVSFTLEQLVYLEATAGFVPKWIPPSQMFWSVTTTLALALGAAPACRSPSAHQLGWQRGELRDHGSGLDRRRLPGKESHSYLFRGPHDTVMIRPGVLGALFGIVRALPCSVPLFQFATDKQGVFEARCPQGIRSG